MASTTLTKAERSVMWYIYRKAREKNFNCILSNDEMINSIPEKYKLNSALIGQILTKLENDGYFELTSTDKKGVPVYIIKCTVLGKAFERHEEQRRREITQRTVTNLIFAALGALTGVLIRFFFQ